jgi:adenylate cyclase class 2
MKRSHRVFLGPCRSSGSEIRAAPVRSDPRIRKLIRGVEPLLHPSAFALCLYVSIMLEIELKFAVADFDPLRDKLRALGSEPSEPHVESDFYHNAPDRDFHQTGEAFRLRRVGIMNRLTYKGPKLAGPTKTRREIEVPLAEGPEAAGDCLVLLEQLGYRPTALVRKVRQEFPYRRDGFDMTICLDELDEIGRFVEVEILAEPDKSAPAQATLLAVAAELGLTASEPRSYLGMVLEHLGLDR